MKSLNILAALATAAFLIGCNQNAGTPDAAGEPDVNVNVPPADAPDVNITTPPADAPDVNITTPPADAPDVNITTPPADAPPAQ